MKDQEHIDTQIITYGVAVHGSTDSGWRVTGFTPGLTPNITQKLVTFTSVGEISETWASVFKHGYAYFGRFEEGNRAVFALFYRSKVESGRGRHFVPRIILSIPYYDYVNILKSNPSDIFEYLVKYKNEKILPHCDETPTQLDDFYTIPRPSELSFSEQIHPLSEAIQTAILSKEFIIDFLTSIIRPSPHTTLIWRGDNPDPSLPLSIIALLPSHLRRYITFCTSVEDPWVGSLKVKLIKKPADPAENSFVMMKDGRFTVKHSDTSFHNELPGLIVNLLMAKGTPDPDELKKMHDFLYETFNTIQWQDIDYNNTLKLTESLAQLYILKMKVKNSPHTEEILNRLLQYRLTLQTFEEKKILNVREILDQEHRFIIIQFERVIEDIQSDYRIDDIADQLGLLGQAFPPLTNKECQRLCDALYQKTHFFNLKSILILIKIFSSIPGLSPLIASELSEKMTLQHLPDWDEAFELIKWFAKENQLDTVKNINTDLYQKLKELPALRFAIDLLLLISQTRDIYPHTILIPKKELGKIPNEHHKKLYPIIRFGFEQMEVRDITDKQIVAFLLNIAYAYSLIKHIDKSETLDLQSLFSLHFSRIAGLEFDSSWDDKRNDIIATLKAENPVFTARLEAVMKQKEFRLKLAECRSLLKQDTNDAPFGTREDVCQFFLQLRDDNRINRHHHLSTAAINILLDTNTVSAETVYGGHLDYLKQKKTLSLTDARNLKTILLSNPSPMKHPRYLLDSLILAFSNSSEKKLVELVTILLESAKTFLQNSIKYLSEIERSLRDTIQEKWKPQSAEEVRRIYHAFQYNLDKSIAGWLLWQGILTLKEETQKMKLLAVAVNEMFHEFTSLCGSDLNYFENLLYYIDSGNPETLPMLSYIKTELLDIKNQKDIFENQIDLLKILHKKLKKFN